MEKISPGILNIQRTFSRVNGDFLEFVQKNEEALKRCSYNDITDFPVGPANKQPWPTFINRRIKKEFQEASVGVFNLIRHIPGRIFHNNPKELSIYYGFPEDQIYVQLESAKGDHMQNLIGRADFIYSAAGLKCCEFNISAGISPERSLFEPVYLQNSFIASFLRQYQVKTYNKNLFETLFRHILNNVNKKFHPAPHSEINIAFALPGYNKIPRNKNDIVIGALRQAYQNVLNQQEVPGNGTFIITEYPQLMLEKDHIYCEGKRIHAVIEWYHGEVPINIMYAALLGNVIIYNGPITILLSNKLNLALLSEHEDSEIFTPEERKIIKNHIPWTRRIIPGKVILAGESVAWEDFLRSQRTKLVIKPVLEFGGKNVAVGKYTPPDQWEMMIQAALEDERRDWMAQEYMEPLPHIYQYGEHGYGEYESIWGLFVFGAEYVGGFLRIIPKNKNIKGVINTSQGAQETVFFEVDD